MEPIKLSKDEKTLEFKGMAKLPTTPKKFRQSEELHEFYKFIYENDLRRETLKIVNEIYVDRKGKKGKRK